MVLLMTQVFWDVMLCHWMSGLWRFKGPIRDNAAHLKNAVNSLAA